jgi:hypothetical protein
MSPLATGAEIADGGLSWCRPAPQVSAGDFSPLFFTMASGQGRRCSAVCVCAGHGSGPASDVANPLVPGSMRCHLHGTAGGRPRGTPVHANSRAARLEGRRRWLERMGLAKAQGLIEKIPGGRRPGVRGRVRSPDPRAARLERRAEKAIEMALTKDSRAP